MRTSHIQYLIMVEFMERNGDLSKPSGGPRGRHFIQQKWKELTDKLNSEGTGDSRSEEKWRKVWSDLKNNTKKKLSKINKAASGTGGGPALKTIMSDIGNRVIQIIGVEAATGMNVMEAGFDQPEERYESFHTQPPQLTDTTNSDMDWNTPGTSSQPTVVAPVQNITASTPSPPTAIIDLEEPSFWKPPAAKKKKKENISKMSELFLESDRSAREYARERAVAFERLEMERLRIQERELEERVRQRDLELQLQAQWLAFMKEALEVVSALVKKEK